MKILNQKFSRILIIPDLHIPFHHINSFKFIKALVEKYDPEIIIFLGDEQDIHSGSMHDHDPNLHSPADELDMALSAFKALYKIVPKALLVESNHGSLFYRRANKNGLPKKVLKTYEEILEAPKGWKWHSDLIIHSSDKKPIYICHGQSADVLRNSKNKAMNYIQGHHHSKFEIRYWSNGMDVFWGVTSGCLIDFESLAFEYGRLMLDKPILGATAVINGFPRLHPMILDERGRWIGKII